MRGLQLAYAARRWLLKVLRWPTHGVKALVFNAQGQLLLIRNHYGRSDLYVLPGGGLHWREKPDDAARREVMEETGCRLITVTAAGVYRSAAEGKRDTVYLFHATTQDVPQADNVEVAEAAFFALGALPTGTSPATLRRIEEMRGVRVPTGIW